MQNLNEESEQESVQRNVEKKHREESIIRTKEWKTVGSKLRSVSVYEKTLMNMQIERIVSFRDNNMKYVPLSIK